MKFVYTLTKRKYYCPHGYNNLREFLMSLRRREGALWVSKAVREGRIPPAKKLLCVDCGAPAKSYDHRDYSKPHEIEAVCHKCHSSEKRGEGHPKYISTSELKQLFKKELHKKMAKDKENGVYRLLPRKGYLIYIP